MNTLKKIWKWIAGIITGLAAIFVIFKTLQDPGKKEFNKNDIDFELIGTFAL